MRALERHILLLTADKNLASALRPTLEAHGWTASWLEDFAAATAMLRGGGAGMVIADLGAGDDAFLRARYVELAAECRKAGAPVIALGEPALAGRLADMGETPADVWIAPLPWRELPGRLEEAREAAQRPAPASARRVKAQMVRGQSAAFQHLLEEIELVAERDTTVLILGETGVGKERVAQAIHAASRRARGEMVAVNCGGIPATLLEDEFFGHVRGAFTDAGQARVGRFEQADGGTLFLDEVGELPLELQPKLLRALQEKTICRIGATAPVATDARIIAATNVDLWSRVGEGSFREDLYYRLNVFPIRVPALRERREDIPALLEYFIERFCDRDGIERKALNSDTAYELARWPWPGNIRELENAVEMAVIRSRDRKTLALEDFPLPRKAPARARTSTPAEADFQSLVSHFERTLIEKAMDRAEGNKTQAAESLGMKRTTLLEKLKKLDQALAASG
ncbi:MAG: sigma-54-dependent Fis family transcriptional regulator [Acidobacteria bacterium]|nr:sigma-54-dependent Fis family transcriptional regulator [Acidobacteriota bacterium]